MPVQSGSGAVYRSKIKGEGCAMKIYLPVSPYQRQGTTAPSTPPPTRITHTSRFTPALSMRLHRLASPSCLAGENF